MEQKSKNQKDRKDNEPELEELLEELRREIESQTGQSNFEIVTLPSPPVTLKSRIMMFAITLILNISILTSLSGFIKWYDYDRINSFVLFIIFFTTLEELLKILINRFVNGRVIVFSFGLIFALGTIIAFIIASLFTPGFRLYDVDATLVMFLFFIVLRSMFRNAFSQYMLRKRIEYTRRKK